MKGKASSSKSRMKGKGSRRASISMGDLRNHAWPVVKKKGDAVIASSDNNLSPPPSLGKKVVVPKPMSVDKGLDQLVNTLPSKDESSTANEQGLDQLVKSLIGAFKNDQGDNAAASLIKSKLMNDPILSSPKNNTPGLNSDEIEVLTKMMRRLSQEQDDSPYQSENDDDNSSIQDEILEGGMKRDCSADDLMDSSTWENKPVHEDITSDDDLNGTSRDSPVGDVRPVAQRMDSFTTLKAGNESGSNIHKHYVPKRTSNTDLKNLEVREVDFNSSLGSEKEESFHTTRFDRSETLSSNLTGEGTNNEESISSLLSTTDRTMSETRSNSGTLGSFSPQKKSDERSDIGSIMSTPQEEREDLHVSTTSSIAIPRLDRSQSVASVTTQGAVTSTDLTREDSISTNCTMPHKDATGMNLPRQRLERGESNKLPSPVLSIHDELDRFEKADSQNSMTFGANNFPRRNTTTGRPIRRTSVSSHSSSGTGLVMRRNSFSSLFTAPTDLDDLDGPPLKENCGDILQEGMQYLSKAMLVNVYAKLRELSMLGHASVKLADIDVNSHQSLAKRKEMMRLGLVKTGEDPYLHNTKTAGAIVRTVLDEYEMLEASNELSFSKVNHVSMEYDASLLSEFKTWVEESKVKQLDSVTEEVIKTLREECSKRQNLVKESGSNDSLSTMEQANVRRSIARRRGSLAEKSDSFQDASWLKQERTLVADHFGIRGGVPSSRSDCDARDASQRISRGVLTDSMIEKTSNAYFQEGSSMRNLLESGIEIVWFSDRHPDDIIYCICVNRETVTVTVVFRGQEGFFDIISSTMSSYSNPLMHEDYEGNSEFINLRGAVSDEIMRVRRDTKVSTLDEIRQKVHKIGSELADGGNYHLSVTGHSLGAGLATVAGFYLASDPSLELASAVRVFTFASSRVGCQAFQRGCKHLEETGRLQHARFTNSNEIRSLLPMQDEYHHVGMQINLHKADSAGRQRARKSLDVSYNSNVSRLAAAFHFVLNFISARTSSRISEYQYRMHFAREYRLALSGGVLRFDKKRNRLKSLNDYYLMKCRLSDFMGMAKEKAQLPSFLVFFLVSCLISFEIALLFKFVATW